MWQQATTGPEYAAYLGLHDVIEDEARARRVNLQLRRIPREVMDP